MITIVQLVTIWLVLSVGITTLLRPQKRRVRTVVLLFCGVLLVVMALSLLALAVYPRSVASATPMRVPQNVEDALAQFQQIQANESHVLPECRSFVLFHGRRTRICVVLFHGLTTSPRQMRRFADQLYQRGMNVVALRAPFHGEIDPKNTSRVCHVTHLDSLTPELLMDYANQAVNLANALGEQVKVLGQSMGGVLALYVASARPELVQVVSVSPGLVPKMFETFSDWQVGCIRNVLCRVHGLFSIDSTEVVLPYVHTGFSGTSTATLLQVSESVKTARVDNQKVCVVWNDSDGTISLSAVKQYVQRNNIANTYTFPAAHRLPHDLFDAPGLEEKEATTVYPPLLEILSQ